MKRRNGRGDCLRQCVARITGRKPSQVPHFTKRCGRGYWAKDLAGWCRRTGHAMVMAPITRTREFRVNKLVKSWIAIGPIRNGRFHAVLCDRTGPVYDGGNRLVRCEWAIVIWRAK